MIYPEIYSRVFTITFLLPPSTRRTNHLAMKPNAHPRLLCLPTTRLVAPVVVRARPSRAANVATYVTRPRTRLPGPTDDVRGVPERPVARAGGWRGGVRGPSARVGDTKRATDAASVRCRGDWALVAVTTTAAAASRASRVTATTSAVHHSARVPGRSDVQWVVAFVSPGHTSAPERRRGGGLRSAQRWGRRRRR